MLFSFAAKYDIRDKLTKDFGRDMTAALNGAEIVPESTRTIQALHVRR